MIIIYNLISEGMSYHFCCVLFVRSDSVGPAQRQRQGIIQEYEYQKAGIIRSLLRSMPLKLPMGPTA